MSRFFVKTYYIVIGTLLLYGMTQLVNSNVNKLSSDLPEFNQLDVHKGVLVAGEFKCVTRYYKGPRDISVSLSINMKVKDFRLPCTDELLDSLPSNQGKTLEIYTFDTGEEVEVWHVTHDTSTPYKYSERYKRSSNTGTYAIRLGLIIFGIIFGLLIICLVIKWCREVDKNSA